MLPICNSGALQGIFTQIINGDDTVREKAIKFLSIKLKLLGEDLITAKIEELIVEESKKVWSSADKTYFDTSKATAYNIICYWWARNFFLHSEGEDIIVSFLASSCVYL